MIITDNLIIIVNSGLIHHFQDKKQIKVIQNMCWNADVMQNKRKKSAFLKNHV